MPSKADNGKAAETKPEMAGATTQAAQAALSVNGTVDAAANSAAAKAQLRTGGCERADVQAAAGRGQAPAGAPPPGAMEQWASRVVAVSSQYSASDNGAVQMLGAPKHFPSSGSFRGCWSALPQAGREVEWVRLGLSTPVQLHAVHVYETHHPGSICRIRAAPALPPAQLQHEANWVVVWARDCDPGLGESEAPADGALAASRIFSPTLPRRHAACMQPSSRSSSTPARGRRRIVRARRLAVVGLPGRVAGGAKGGAANVAAAKAAERGGPVVRMLETDKHCRPRQICGRACGESPPSMLSIADKPEPPSHLAPPLPALPPLPIPPPHPRPHPHPGEWHPPGARRGGLLRA